MDGTGYEQWCAKWLAKNGYRNVTKTKASNDQGIDLIAERGGLKWGFQCKYYTSAVGNEAVQQAYAGMAYYGLDRAGVLCSSTFTKSAEKLAEETGVMLVDGLVPSSSGTQTLLLKIIAAAALLLCGSRFYGLIHEAAQLPQREMSILAFALLGGLCALCAGSRISVYVFSALFAGIYSAACLFTGAYTDALNVIMTLILMLALIRMTILLRQKNAENLNEERKQLYDVIAQNERELGENIAGLLCGQLGTQVRMEKAFRRSGGTFETHCHSVRDVSGDLAVAVFSLNMQADAERQNIRFEYEKKDDTHFVIFLKDRKEDSRK